MTEDKVLAMSFLECDDPVRYKTLWYSLREKSLTGADYYPKTLTGSSNTLVHYRPPVTHTIPRDGGGKQQGEILHFTQVKGNDQQCDVIEGTGGNTRADVTF